MNGRRVVHDAGPGVLGENLRGRALIEEAVAVEQLTPALLVSPCGLADNHLARKSLKHECPCAWRLVNRRAASCSGYEIRRHRVGAGDVRAMSQTPAQCYS